MPLRPSHSVKSSDPHTICRQEATHGSSAHPRGASPWAEGVAYILGAKVTHNGRLWECTQVNAGVNSYEPGVWGWTDIGAAP